MAENEVQPNPTTVDGEGYRVATKVYSNHEAVLASTNEVAVLFGTTLPAGDPGTSVQLPHTIVHMTHGHFRTFVDMLNVQVKMIDSMKVENR